ncbi:MAG: STAS domain-containing protein [Methanolinea sp.]|jgi:anti-sigma B factor antagonist|nr:STAS domain-containing protein [Methanolinea sp.]
MVSASFQVSTKQDGDVDIILFSGRMDANSSPEGENAIQSLVRSGRTKIVVNASGLSYISSSGLRVLLAGLKQARQAGGDLRLACLQPQVHDVIAMTGFNRIFTIFEQEEQAVGSFFS